MCDCPKCTAVRETKLTPEQTTQMKQGIDVLFERVLPDLPASIATCVHALMQSSLRALASVAPVVAQGAAPLAPEIGVDAQLRALAIAYGIYWTIADAGLREEAVLHLREKLKAATPKLMQDVRAVLVSMAPDVVAMLMEIEQSKQQSKQQSATAVVDRTKLN